MSPTPTPPKRPPIHGQHESLCLTMTILNSTSWRLPSRQMELIPRKCIPACFFVPYRVQTRSIDETRCVFLSSLLVLRSDSTVWASMDRVPTFSAHKGQPIALNRNPRLPDIAAQSGSGQWEICRKFRIDTPQQKEEQNLLPSCVLSMFWAS